jgi:hypothetical protein
MRATVSIAASVPSANRQHLAGMPRSPRRLRDMKFPERLEAWMTREPFEPFVIVSTAGRSWTIAAAECLTFDSTRSILNFPFRDDSGWRDGHLRIAEIVAIERPSTDLGPWDIQWGDASN